jgi:DNA-binding NarL/FixJ family response regulator
VAIGHADPPIRVVILDHQPLMIEAIRRHLAHAGMAVVGAAGTAVEALRFVSELTPDVLLLDLDLPLLDMSGIELVQRVRDTAPAVAVLVFTGYQGGRIQRALLGLGVRGYLPKTATGRELVAAIQAMARGETIIYAEAVPEVAGYGQPTLTSREREVLELLGSSMSNKEIAEQLSVSEKTVQMHIHHVLVKLGARSRTDAVLKAVRQGLIDLK